MEARTKKKIPVESALFNKNHKAKQEKHVFPNKYSVGQKPKNQTFPKFFEKNQSKQEKITFSGKFRKINKNKVKILAI
jgi:hypothetical protein